MCKLFLKQSGTVLNKMSGKVSTGNPISASPLPPHDRMVFTVWCSGYMNNAAALYIIQGYDMTLFLILCNLGGYSSFEDLCSVSVLVMFLVTFDLLFT
jgi:hypothetical protein